MRPDRGSAGREVSGPPVIKPTTVILLGAGAVVGVLLVVGYGFSQMQWNPYVIQGGLGGEGCGCGG